MLTDYCALTNENIDIQSSKEKRFLTLSVSASFFLSTSKFFSLRRLDIVVNHSFLPGFYHVRENY